jgi:DNA-binding response OmpR family regulator
MLLETRRLMLERCGFRVWVAGSVEAAELLLGTKRVALLVLCHTVSEVERRRVLTAARAADSEMRTVALLAGYTGRLEESDVIVHQVEGPRGFLSAIQGILQG